MISSSQAITATARNSSPFARCMVLIETWPPAVSTCSSRILWGNPHRPQVPVSGFFDHVELCPGIDRVELQVEGGHLDRLLLLAGQPRETVGEGVGDAEASQFSIPCHRTAWS